MSEFHSSERARRIARVLGGLSLAVVAIGVVFVLMLIINDGELVTAGYSASEVYLLVVTTFLIAISYNVLGLLILLRHPKHMVGWIFLILAFAPAMAILSYVIAETAGPTSGLPYDIGNWVGELSFIPTYTVPVTLVLQYFPTGRLPSRRWWPLPVLTLFGIFSQTASAALHPWPWEAAGIYTGNNPFGIAGSEQFFELINSLSSIAMMISLVGSLAVVVVRYRRSKGTERTQIKWLAFAAVIGILTILSVEVSLMVAPSLGIELPSGARVVSGALFFLLPVLLSLAIGIAILRHRLFDIDVIIRRTIQYAVLTGLLALVYLGTIVTLQSIFSIVGNQESPIFIVISTLVIAALFNPLRIRVQDIIDSRFYRKKYEAEKALNQFAAAARDEVDLEKLSHALLEVVQETMQPAHIGFKLFGEEK